MKIENIPLELIDELLEIELKKILKIQKIKNKEKRLLAGYSFFKK